MDDIDNRGTVPYRTFGRAVYEYLVPTAACAGLLLLMVRTFEAYPQMSWSASPDLQLIAGWFTAILFMVSATQEIETKRSKTARAMLVDILEAILMVGVFHALGLIDSEREWLPFWFYLGLGAFLAVIVVRRYALEKRGGERSGFTHLISALTVVVIAVLGWRLVAEQCFEKEFPSDCAIVSGLVIALVAYLLLACLREKNKHKQNGKNGTTAKIPAPDGKAQA